jgi:ubiquinone/menaquinone biosynthesis C-methylase UbiE
MEQHEKTRFDTQAKSWDEDPMRVELARKVTEAILSQVPVNREMDALDYGCGTGLVTLGIQPHLRSITGADSSTGMLSVLHEKIDVKGLENVKTLLLDLEKDPTPASCFNLIVTSMTTHHIADPAGLIDRFASMLRPGGYLAVADLDLEGGLFHRDNTGVLHFGFDRKEMKEFFRKAGFEEILESTAVTFTREVNDRPSREFSLFLISGRRQGF